MKITKNYIMEADLKTEYLEIDVGSQYNLSNIVELLDFLDNFTKDISKSLSNISYSSFYQFSRISKNGINIEIDFGDKSKSSFTLLIKPDIEKKRCNKATVSVLYHQQIRERNIFEAIQQLSKK